jgi:hypothetical protein
MRRLFAFGCSFTNYRWSTWADCLAPEFDHFENWGQSGGGNQYIFNSFIEADQRNGFGANDTVIICWTHHMRDDRYANKKWHTLGNIFTCPIYRADYLKDHVDGRGYMIRDLAIMQAVKLILAGRPEVEWRFLSTVQMGADPLDSDNKDVCDLYKDVIGSVAPSYINTVFRLSGWPDRDGDPHPAPDEHLAYLDAVLPGWVTKPETRAIMHEETMKLGKDPHRTGMTKVTRL